MIRLLWSESRLSFLFYASFFSLLCVITGFISWVTQRMLLEEQVLLTRRDKPSSSQVLVRFVNNKYSILSTIVCLFVFILLTIVLLAFLIAFFDIFKLFLCQNSVFPTILEISVSKLNGDICKLPTQYNSIVTRSNTVIPNGNMPNFHSRYFGFGYQNIYETLSCKYQGNRDF